MNRLKELRNSAGYTQTALAEAAETTQRNISYWESGKIELNLYAAIRLAQIFQVDVEYLAGYSDDFGIKPDLKLPKNDGMTAKEREMLEAFRKLLPETQDFILRSTQSLRDKKSVT